jgi:hypothetical protein
MAKAAPVTAPTRAAVTARGVALLALIAASTSPAEGVLMLTQDEGAEAVAAGFASVDGSIVENDTAAVSLTDAGKAALASDGATATAVAASNGFEIDSDVPMPTASGERRSRSGGYPFEALPVGGSFHVKMEGSKAKSMDDLLNRLSSSVSGARTKFSEETGETETVEVRAYEKTEDGKDFVKDDAGKRVIKSRTSVERPKLKVVRDFKAAIVDDKDPKGAGVRVWRTV